MLSNLPIRCKSLWCQKRLKEVCAVIVFGNLYYNNSRIWWKINHLVDTNIIGTLPSELKKSPRRIRLVDLGTSTGNLVWHSRIKSYRIALPVYVVVRLSGDDWSPLAISMPIRVTGRCTVWVSLTHRGVRCCLLLHKGRTSPHGFWDLYVKRSPHIKGIFLWGRPPLP